VACQAASFVAGLALSWFVVGEAWVQFDSFVPMWTVAALIAVAAAWPLLIARSQRFAGFSIGLALSAVTACILFTQISSGSGIVPD
jgi:hypothetical protein